jgi:hypothetical protein
VGDTHHYTFVHIHAMLSAKNESECKVWTLSDIDMSTNEGSWSVTVYHCGMLCAVGDESIWEVSVTSSPFYCEPKTPKK